MNSQMIVFSIIGQMFTNEVFLILLHMKHILIINALLYAFSFIKKKNNLFDGPSC